MVNRSFSQRGFTLVELTIVIVILSILAAYAASRFQGPSSFSPYAAQAQTISVIRQIQLARMQSNLPDGSTNDQYQLFISENCLGSQAACSGNDSLSSKVQIDGQSLRFTVSPNANVIEFDLLGRPLPIVTTSGVPMGTDYTVTIQAQTNNVESTKVCINTEGFVYGGECQ